MGWQNFSLSGLECQDARPLLGLIWAAAGFTYDSMWLFLHIGQCITASGNRPAPVAMTIMVV
jgi:hypothetical protein